MNWLLPSRVGVIRFFSVVAVCQGALAERLFQPWRVES